MKIRTRFAPSPTGMMHVGNLRSAIFAYLICKKDQGEFILRIEDTDQTRKVEGALEFIYDTLKICGITFDEGPLNPGDYGPYIQSERLDIYPKYAEQLVEQGDAYYCFCTSERLEKLRREAEAKKVPFLYDGFCRGLSESEIESNKQKQKPVIRQKIPKTGTVVYEDLVYGKMTFQNNLLEDQILIKSDGYPTYNFANVIDDHLMKITHVIRANEYLTATPKYNLLYEALGFPKPVYIHLPMVVDENGRKLGKRHGAVSFMELYEQGYLAEAVVNYLVLLGWKPESTKEIFSLPELIKEFDPKRINKAPAKYDLKKLQWVNAHYIKKLSLTELVALVYPFLEKEYGKIDQKWAKHLIKIHQNHLSYGQEIIAITEMFFHEDYQITSDAKAFLEENKEEANKVIKAFVEQITNLDQWEVTEISQLIKQVGEQLNVRGKGLYMPIRIAVSGQMHGPELPDTIYLLGKEKLLANVEKVLN